MIEQANEKRNAQLQYDLDRMEKALVVFAEHSLILTEGWRKELFGGYKELYSKFLKAKRHYQSKGFIKS